MVVTVIFAKTVKFLASKSFVPYATHSIVETKGQKKEGTRRFFALYPGDDERSESAP